MGTSGLGAFENDDALDWSEDLVQTGRVELLREALTRDLVDAEACCLALAAAQVVAVSLGYSAPDRMPDSLLDWIEADNASTISLDLREHAADRVGAIRHESELAQLWRDTDDYSAWAEQLEELENDLRGVETRSRRRKVRRPRPKRVKVALGDVIELPSSKGLVYVQVSAIHRNWGHLVRILPGFFERSPVDLDALVREPSVARCFCLIETAFRRGEGKTIGNFAVPSTEAGYPLFREGRLNPITRAVEYGVLDLNRDTTNYQLDASNLPKLSAADPGYLTQALESGKIAPGLMPQR